MRERRPSDAFGIVGVVIGLVANLITAYAALSLLAEPDGARIRPMGEAFMVFFGTADGIVRCGYFRFRRFGRRVRVGRESLD